jgi:hypothetical protein
MDPDAPIIISTLAILCGTTIVVLRMFLNRRRPEDSPSRKELQELHERLARIEQAVDSIAIETQRVLEGQRFTTKLLSERPALKVEVPQS